MRWPALAVCALLPLNASTLFVSPAGRAGAPGTVEQPLDRIQTALDRAGAGDTVRVLKGVYRERVVFANSGEYNRPVVLEGEHGATLDGSEPAAYDWQPAPDVAPGTWRAKLAFVPFTIVADGKIVTLLDERRTNPKAVANPAWHWPEIFKNGIGPSKWDGVKALALYLPASRELLLRFKGDLDPHTIPLVIAPREPVVKIEGADRCVVRGLTLRNAAYGVRIDRSIGSVVEGCTIGPVDYGVWLDDDSDRCTVRFCELFMNPYAGADPHQRPGSWDNWQAHKTGGFYDRYGIQVHNTRGGHEIHDNDIHDTWDGIEDRGGPGQNVGLRIHHNRIFNISDDGLEPNGAEEDCRWADNTVRRCICGFRVKAPQVGPMYAYRNVLWDNSEDFRNYGEVTLRPAVVYIYQNTSTASPAVMSNKVFGIGTPNYHYFGNLFWCRNWWSNTGASVDPNWKGDYNTFVGRADDDRWQQGLALAKKLGLDLHSRFVVGEPGFQDAEHDDFSLKPDSPAVGRSTDLAKLLVVDLPGLPPATRPVDCGALQLGEPMPRLPRRPGEVTVPPAGSWPGPEARRGSPTEGPNLLGELAQALPGWDGAKGDLYVVGDGGPNGAKVLHITATGRSADLTHKLPDLTPGKTYVFACSSRGSTFADCRVIVRDLANQGYLANIAPAKGEAWKQAVARFVVPPGGVRLEISPRSAGVAELSGLGVYAAP